MRDEVRDTLYWRCGDVGCVGVVAGKNVRRKEYGQERVHTGCVSLMRVRGSQSCSRKPGWPKCVGSCWTKEQLDGQYYLRTKRASKEKIKLSWNGVQERTKDKRMPFER